MTVRSLLYKVDPYEYIDASDHELDITGWNSTHPKFEELIGDMKPKRICEVGSWKGASAIHMAATADNLSRPYTQEIVCVDTWLGSAEFWEEGSRYDDLKIIGGYPSVYYTFAKNVKYLGFDRLITPCPMTSAIAARFFQKNNVTFDFVYIDASHDTEDVLADARAYSKLTDVLMGDDYDWDSVKAAVHILAEENFGQLEIDKEKWIFRFR